MENNSRAVQPSNSSSQGDPVAASIPTAQEWKRLLQQILGKEEGAALAASLARREVVISSPEDKSSRREIVIDVTSPEEACEVVVNVTSPEGKSSGTIAPGTQKPAPLSEGTPAASSKHDKGVVTEEPDSVLHVVAAAGDSERYLKCASEIYAKASHLLTLAAPSSKGDTPLHCAARAGNTRMVSRLMELAGRGEGGPEKASNLVKMQNKRGETALHEAIRFNHLEMVGALTAGEDGGDPELAQVEANDGTSPLYLACSLGHCKIVKKLLKKKGYYKEPSYSGPRGQNALHAAVLRNNKGMTESLLLRNPDLAKQKDMDGSTPLHFAASAPDISLQFTLFVFSASNLEYYSMGFYFLPPRCLTRIFERFNLPLPQLLEADPTSAFQPDNHGSFPVHVAASADCMVPLIILLTRYPGCAGLRDPDGRTFLHIAVQKKRFNVVRFVCRWWGRPYSKSVVNIQDKNGDTALHIAVREGELDMARWLIGNRHSQINLENNEGKTPMDLATGGVKSGFYFGLTARRRILSMLNFADAVSGNRRRDRIPEYSPRLDEETESAKIKDFAQIVGIGSVLVATATFAAALTMPGGVWSPGDASGNKKLAGAVAAPPPAGTPVLIGSYAFEGFVISNTLAFICSTLATFSLVYCGVAAVDIQKRIELVSFSLALLLCSARSFSAAFAFALYLLLADVEHGTAIASCVMTSLALLDGVWFLMASFNDMSAFLKRKTKATLLELGIGFLANMVYLFWPYLVIAGFLSYEFVKRAGRHGQTHRH